LRRFEPGHGRFVPRCLDFSYSNHAACRFVSVRAGRVFEVLRFVPVRVKIRLRVARFVSRVSEICLRVTRVGIRAPHCVFVCLCVSCMSRVMRVACHACQHSCVSCVSRVMRVWIGCDSVRVRVRFLRVCGSCLFLRVLDNIESHTHTHSKTWNTSSSPAFSGAQRFRCSCCSSRRCLLLL
jgi:hypothetical protein